MKTIRTRVVEFSKQTALLAGLFFASESLQAQYCIPMGNCSFGDEILNFSLNTINNNSVCSGSYSDFSGSISTTLSAGIPYPYSAVFGFGSQSLALWLDMNQDSDFDDAGEFISSVPYVSGAMTANGTLTIPGSISSGSYRLRVRNWWLNDFMGLPAEGWDGTYKGRLQPQDVYHYTLIVEFSSKERATKKGDITLLR